LELTGHLVFLILFLHMGNKLAKLLAELRLPILAPQGDGYVKVETLAGE
jgi:hypothetical protein